MDYLIPGLGGFITGAAIFGLTYQSVYPKLSAIANYGAKSLPQLWHINHWLLIIFFVLVTVLLLYLLEKQGELRRDKLQPPSPDEPKPGAPHKQSKPDASTAGLHPSAQTGR